MYNITGLKEQFGDLAAELFGKAVARTLSVEDVKKARAGTEEDLVSSVVRVVAGHNIDDPDKTVTVLGVTVKMAYCQPEVMCDDVIYAACADMGWDYKPGLEQVEEV